MGGACFFRRTLIRRPLKKWKPYKRAGGPHEGIYPENLRWEIYVVCSNGHGIDAHTYHMLDTCIDLDGLMDLLELAEVHQSWKSAEAKNAELLANA